MTPNRELRARARNALRGNWGMAVLITLLYMLISGAIGAIPVIGSIIVLIIVGPLMLGLYGYYLELYREGNTSIDGLFAGFKQFGKAFAVYWLMILLVLLWSLLAIIPVVLFAMHVIPIWLLVVLGILCYIPGIVAYYRYALSYYVLKDDPAVGPLNAIRESKRLMEGRKGKLFLLQLSFIGWALLSIVTVGIGFLFLMPYIYTSLSAFYDDVRGHAVPFRAGDPAGGDPIDADPV